MTLTLLEQQNIQSDAVDRETKISEQVLSGVPLMDIDLLTGETPEERIAEQQRLSDGITERQTEIDRLLAMEATAQKNAAAALQSAERVAQFRQRQAQPPSQVEQRVAPVLNSGLHASSADPTVAQFQPSAQQSPVYHAMTEMDAKPTILEYAYRALNGNLLNLRTLGPVTDGEGGPGHTLVIPTDEINLNAIQVGANIATPIGTTPPVTYEGDMPIHVPDLVRMRPTSMGTMQWTETTAKATNAMMVAAGAAAADLSAASGGITTAKRQITVTRVSGMYDVDNVQLDTGMGFFEWVMDEVLSDYGIQESAQYTVGNGTAPNQRGFFSRQNTTSRTFSKGTNPEASYFAAVAAGQGIRTKGGFGGGTHLIEPEWFWRLVNYREQGRPILEQIQNSPIPAYRGYGMVWQPVVGFDSDVLGANDKRAGVSVNLGRNVTCWVQRMELRVLTEIRSAEDETRFLFNMHRMIQIARGLDVVTFKSAA